TSAHQHLSDPLVTDTELIADLSQCHALCRMAIMRAVRTSRAVVLLTFVAPLIPIAAPSRVPPSRRPERRPAPLTCRAGSARAFGRLRQLRLRRDKQIRPTQRRGLLGSAAPPLPFPPDRTVVSYDLSHAARSRAQRPRSTTRGRHRERRTARLRSSAALGGC